MNNKIGIGVITCNREEFFKKCINSIPNVDKIVVINDGKPYSNDVYPKGLEVIQHTTNKCVGVSKNEALRCLIQNNCDHLFLMEDDIFIKNTTVFDEYIKTASIFGVWHLNYALHGSYNRDKEGNPIVKGVISDESGKELYLYHNCLGAFSYYLKGIIKNIGYMDERYINAMEHVDHTLNIIKAKLHPPFWWFADIAKSWEYIEDIKSNFEGSEIRKDKEQWAKNFNLACGLFKHKHQYIPMQMPETPKTEVLKILENLQNTYAKK